MLTLDEKRALVERHFLELLDGRNPEIVDAAYAEDIIARDPMGILTGRDHLRQWAVQVHQAFPNHRFIVHYVIVEGQRAVCRFTARATFSQPFLKQDPTNRRFVMNAVALFLFAEDQIQEIEVVYDTRVFIEEIGADPPIISGL